MTMTKPTFATTHMQSTARVSDGIATADRCPPLGDAGLALRVLATAVRVKLHERDLLDERRASDDRRNCASVDN